MHLLEEYSIFRLRRVVSILGGVFTITAYAHGSLDFLRDPARAKALAFGELALFFVLCGGYLMNDYCDTGIDAVNRPERVYIGSKLSRNAALVLFCLLFAAGMAVALAAGPEFLIVVIAQSAALAVYNLFSKRMSWAKPVFVSLLLVSIYPLSLVLAGGGVDTPRRDSLFIFPAWLFLSTVAFELAADTRDAAGDARGGGGYVERFGTARVLRAARLLAVIAVPVAFVPFFAAMCGRIYLAGAVLSTLVLCAGLFLARPGLPKTIHLYIVGVTLASLIDLAVMP